MWYVVCEHLIKKLKSKTTNFIILLQLLVLCKYLAVSEAFWWPSTTTEQPSLYKHLPLTYYRTYTYQPFGAEPIIYPFMSGPRLLGGSEMQFDPFDHTLSGLKKTYNNQLLDVAKLYSTTKPTTTTRSTTTTTTTTPAPTTTTTTTPFNEGARPLPYDYFGEYSAFNKRKFTKNFPSMYHRQNYPFPSYGVYEKPEPVIYERGAGSNVPYLPCLCPASPTRPLRTDLPPPYGLESRESDEGDDTREDIRDVYVNEEPLLTVKTTKTNYATSKSKPSTEFPATEATTPATIMQNLKTTAK